MANTVCPTRIDVRMTIYAHVIIALTPIHILSSSLTLTLIQIVSSRTKVQTQQGPTKGGWYWHDGVSVATVLVFAKCFGAHSVPLLLIVHHCWHNTWIEYTSLSQRTFMLSCPHAYGYIHRPCVYGCIHIMTTFHDYSDDYYVLLSTGHALVHTLTLMSPF